ncbi:early nodulin-like protein 3 [Momordica charantia]|uniref:Early nodulin-like protein 3 n=1 Tax=Momordica charantia TaxID=3673 RepID=A0A6J1CGB6_MOMCH|nr:early nodulin-like protein 3 [Momordica charantia]
MAKLGFAFGVLMCLMVLVKEGDGTEFTVGGAKGWSLPMAQTYNQWAEANRFQIGDSLVFNYAADEDSVLQVTQDEYNSCSIQSPIKQFSDGHTVFQFDKSGPYYFISGNKDNCLKNEKLAVVVLADRSNSTSNQTITLPPSPSPSPSPAPANDQTGTASPPPSGSGSTEIIPSPPPAEEVSPSPAPTGEESPPAGMSAINPTPPPLLVQPPPSVGFSIIPSSIGSIGAFVAVAILAFF